MGFSQQGIAQLMGNNEQTIAIWEKRGNMPKWLSNFLRKLVSEYLGENRTLTEIVEKFSDLDRDAHENAIKFEESNHHWKVAA